MFRKKSVGEKSSPGRLGKLGLKSGKRHFQETILAYRILGPPDRCIHKIEVNSKDSQR